ncbi:MAG: carbon-nitrogen hydrolase [Bacteroidales bacterium]|nr:carbon-nitrogen hydrolase [Bacteroidales bacterium]
MSNKVKVGYVQMPCVEDKAVNILRVEDHLLTLVRKGARIICLQELFSTLYFCNSEDHDNFLLAEPLPGNTTEHFGRIAREHDIVIILSLFEKRATGLYHNTAAIIDTDGSLLGIYRKSHIPDDPGFHEKFYFSPGDTGYKVFKTKYASIGILICWDQWFPEAARITSLMGAEIIFYPAAIGWDMNEKNAKLNEEQLRAWKIIQQSHAIANGIHVVAVNRTGIEARTNFWGSSFACNPFGTPVYESPADKEDYPVFELDLSLTGYYRTTWPFLRDRRIDTYETVLKRFHD